MCNFSWNKHTPNIMSVLILHWFKWLVIHTRGKRCIEDSEKKPDHLSHTNVNYTLKLNQSLTKQCTFVVVVVVVVVVVLASWLFWCRLSMYLSRPSSRDSRGWVRICLFCTLNRFLIVLKWCQTQTICFLEHSVK